MTHSHGDEDARTILLVGASRGFGLAMADTFARLGWKVLATVRNNSATELRSLAAAHGDGIAIETLDITKSDQIAALRGRIADRRFDMLFVNAGTANMNDEPVGEIADEEFARVMRTNALGPMRVIEALQSLVLPDGVIGAMSSGQGSIADNTNGRHPVYHASKSALNQLMRSFAAAHDGDTRALVLMAPGWIRTALGGPRAPFGVDETIPAVVDVLIAQTGRPGLRYLDRFGGTVAW